MSVAPAGLDVVCPSCGGRSVVEPAFRSFPNWGCPFCDASNPIDVQHREDASPDRLRGRTGTVIAATTAIAVALVAVVVQSSIPRGDYRTVEGISSALADRGMPCRATRVDPAAEAGIREAATCVIEGTGVRILTFASSQKRDRYLAARRPGVAVAGATWVVVPDDPAMVRRIMGAIGGRATGPPGAARAARHSESGAKPVIARPAE